MNLAQLLKRKEICKVEPDLEFAKRLILASEGSIRAAEDNLKIGHNDVCLSLAYNAMLNCARALMAAKGYRAYSENHHKAAVNFCAEYFGAESAALTTCFNKFRVRRHDIVYGEIAEDSVGTSEAEDAIKKSKNFLGLIKSKIIKNI